MADLPKLPQITLEEVDDAPDYIQSLISPINLFFLQTYQALSTLSIGQNLIGKIFTFDLVTSSLYPTVFSPVTFRWGIQKNAQSIIIGQIVPKGNFEIIKDPITVSSWLQNGNDITLYHITGLAASKTYTVTVVCF